MAAVAAAQGTAGAVVTTGTTAPTVQNYLDNIAPMIEEPGSPGTVDALANPSPTSFPGEDPAAVIAPPVLIRFRFASYVLDTPISACASYHVTATAGVTADGPDLIAGSFLLLTLSDDGGELFGGNSVVGAGSVGASVDADMDVTVAGADVDGHLVVVYGAPTAWSESGSSASWGSTFEIPTVDVVVDSSGCPTTTTTTTTTTTAAPSATAPPTMPPTVPPVGGPPAPGKPLAADTATARPGGSVTVGGDGFAPRSKVTISIGDTPITSVTTDDGGAFIVVIRIPAGVSGSQLLTATGVDPEGRAVTQVRGLSITNPLSSSSAPRSLALTGTTRSGQLLTFGGAALLGGAALMVGRRRAPR